jgi:zinc protease
MRMGFLLASLDDDDVERERAAVLHEQRERGRSGLGIEVQRSLRRALWGSEHPYAREHETEDSVERIRLEHVRWFFQRWYGPKNATIAVVSPEDPRRVQARIAHYFGALRGTTPPERPHPELPTPDSARFVVLAPLIRDVLIFAWTSPRYHEADDAALDLVADVVEERLGELFEDDENVIRVSARVLSLSRGSTFEITLVGDDEVDLAPYVARVHEVLDALRDEGPTDAEMAEARRLWSRSRGHVRWSPLGTARRLASSRVFGRPDLPVRDERYETADDDAVRSAARRWLTLDREVLVHRRMHGFGSREGTVRRRSLR